MNEKLQVFLFVGGIFAAGVVVGVVSADAVPWIIDSLPFEFRWK